MAKRVAHLIGSVEHGGVQQLLLNLMRTPTFREHEHVVVSLLGFGGVLEKEFEREGVRVVRCPVYWGSPEMFPSYRLSRAVRQLSRFTFKTRLTRALMRLDPHVIHTHLTHRVDWQAAVAARLRKPWVWTFHGMYQPDEVELRRWRRAVELTVKIPKRITVVSETLKHHLTSVGFPPPTDCRVIYSGVELSRFRGARTDENALRKSLKLDERTTLIGAVGRLVPVKGFDRLVEMAATLIAEGRDVAFVVAGEGGQRAELEARIAELGIGSRFHLLGFQSDVAAFMRGLDVFVLPSNTEGFGMVVVEAMAAGLPVVAFNVGGVGEILSQGGGIVVAPDDLPAFQAAIRLLLNPEERERVRQNAVDGINRFSVQTTAEGYLAVYDGLLGAVETASPAGTQTANLA